MLRSAVLKTCSFKPTSPLNVVKTSTTLSTSSRSASSLSAAALQRDQENSVQKWPLKPENNPRLSEEEVRRFVVGLSTMLKDGKLKPSTSHEQVVLHFVAQNNSLRAKDLVKDQVYDILERKTKAIKRKHDNSSVLEWIY